MFENPDRRMGESKCGLSMEGVAVADGGQSRLRSGWYRSCWDRTRRTMVRRCRRRGCFNIYDTHTAWRGHTLHLMTKRKLYGTDEADIHRGQPQAATLSKTRLLPDIRWLGPNSCGYVEPLLRFCGWLQLTFQRYHYQLSEHPRPKKPLHVSLQSILTSSSQDRFELITSEDVVQLCHTTAP